jgi:hypothetical protein
LLPSSNLSIFWCLNSSLNILSYALWTYICWPLMRCEHTFVGQFCRKGNIEMPSSGPQMDALSSTDAVFWWWERSHIHRIGMLSLQCIIQGLNLVFKLQQCNVYPSCLVHDFFSFYNALFSLLLHWMIMMSCPKEQSSLIFVFMPWHVQ